MNRSRIMCRVFLVVLSLLLVAACGQATPRSSGPLVVQEGSATPSAPTTRPADTGGTAEQPTGQAATEKPTIALVMKTLTNPFFVEMEKGARKAEKELGITLVVRTGAQETSIEQQISIIQSLIDEKVQAIVIAPADSKELIPVLKQAQDAGIVIINIDNRLDAEVSKSLGLANVPFISVDNEQGAYLSAQYLSKHVTAPTEAIILEGIRTAGNAEDRKNGALRAFAENPNITVVASETANWKIDEGYDVTATLFKQHPNVNVVFCANDMMAFGTLRYLEEAGKTDVLVASYDALEEAKQFIRDGKLQATIDQQAALQGETGVQFAVRALKGEQLAPEQLVDVLLVTTENVDQ